MNHKASFHLPYSNSPPLHFEPQCILSCRLLKLLFTMTQTRLHYTKNHKAYFHPHDSNPPPLLKEQQSPLPPTLLKLTYITIKTTTYITQTNLHYSKNYKASFNPHHSNSPQIHQLQTTKCPSTHITQTRIHHTNNYESLLLSTLLKLTSIPNNSKG